MITIQNKTTYRYRLIQKEYTEINISKKVAKSPRKVFDPP